ncbi:hypothetical protein I316_04856 [Kwoniella heveanensis BCC8398]|uniref:Uncharacterized protein n=1 Tax=Kwoniella heveanensis BCC8398 TaxID=1296120 RepID=A0A1B9GQY7_9TREE|nr:hypothetical protein I316_04856 [Kwoniella heveanensis BCC8398]
MCLTNLVHLSVQATDASTNASSCSANQPVNESSGGGGWYGANHKCECPACNCQTLTMTKLCAQCQKGNHA